MNSDNSIMDITNILYPQKFLFDHNDYTILRMNLHGLPIMIIHPDIILLRIDTLRCHQTWLAGKWTIEIGDVPS